MGEVHLSSLSTGGRSGPLDIATIRKEQIVEAAIAVITEQGIQGLSLSEIETKAGMSRGQLTYYFRTKEAILLAVFDRVLQLMYQRLAGNEGPPKPGPCEAGSGWELAQLLLTLLLTRPRVSPEFDCLQFTFLSQIAHREDFRQRLASLYEEWRSHMAAGLAHDQQQGLIRTDANPRALATLIQALLHGMTVQAAADPAAFDGREMLELSLDVLRTYLQPAR